MRVLIVCIMLVLFCHCSMPEPAGAEEYSLRDLYRIALEKAETIRIADENIAYSVQDRRRAIAALLPRLSAFTSYQKFDEERYNTSQILTYTEDVLVQPDHGQAWGLRADQNLSLSLREITAVRIGSNDIRRSRYDLNAVQETYLLEVAQSYYNVLMARKVLDIAKSNLERVSKYRDAAQSRLNVGEITETVLLRADSELSSAKSNMVKAQNSLSLADATLARLVGIGPSFTLSEEPMREATVPPLEELKTTAFAQRPDLKSLETQEKMARQQVSFARGAYWPNLSISGVFQRADQEPYSAALNTETTYGSVSLVFPFFEGGLRRAEVQQAKARERQASLRYESEKKTVSLEVERAYLDLMTRKGTIDFLRDQLKFAQDNYRGVLRQFTLGLASSIDVIDANNLLVSSQRQLAEAVYSYQLAILEVERATGTFMKEVQEKT